MAEIPDHVRGALATARLAIAKARRLDKQQPRPPKDNPKNAK